MVRLINPPKDTLRILAGNLAEFQHHKGMWQSNGVLLYADYSEGVYEAAALFSGKVVMMQYHEPEKGEKEEITVNEPEENNTPGTS